MRGASLGAQLAWRMVAVMILSGAAMIALAYLVLRLDDAAQVARLPSEVREEFQRLDALASAGGMSPAEERRLAELLVEHPLGARPGAVLLAVVGPVALVSAAGAGVAALAARRIAAPISAVAAQVRRLAEGDLEARAGPLVAQATPGEIARLVADFDRLGERLQAAEGALRRDAALIAHELRTPLMVLRGRLEALTDGLFAPSEAEFRRLLGQTELLGRVVEDLSTLSLAQAGRLTLRMQVTDLSDAARTAAAAFDAQAGTAGVRMQLALRPAPVMGDPQRLAQAAAALLDNALRHAAGREVTIEAGAEKGQAFLCVLDRGPGVPEPLRPRVFAPFERDAGPAEGSGLGLAVVQAVVAAHGGAARSEPRPGGGAVFRIELPAMVGDDVPAEPQGPTRQA